MAIEDDKLKKKVFTNVHGGVTGGAADRRKGTVRMGGTPQQQLSKQNPVVAGIANAVAMPDAQKAKRKEDRMSRMKNSFLRTPPQASDAANPKVIAPQSTGVPATGQLSMVSNHGIVQAAPSGEDKRLYTNVHGGIVGGQQDKDSGTVRIGATPQSSLAAANVPEPQMMASHKVGGLPQDRLGRNTAPGSGRITLSSTGETAEIDSSGNMKYFDSSGAPTDKLSQKLGGSPSGVNRPQAGGIGTPGMAPQLGGAGGMAASNRMAQIQKLMPQEKPELISFETNPNMDWRQAAALNNTAMQGYNQERQTAIQAMGGMGKADVTGTHGMDQSQQNGANQLATTAAIGGNRLDQIAAIADENRTTARQQPAPAPKQHFVPPEFGLDGKQISGTGVWSTAPPSKLSNNFNLKKPSQEDRAYLQNLNDTGQYDLLYQIEQKFGL